ncbi:MAG TPA: hypothetical protein VFQ67_10680 [Allosphingosinicella sp.]|jgi:hypothetical protein|nr:hypothetical protein [Allosphingosinicella sp.]
MATNTIAPPYHTAFGDDVTVYLNIIQDTGGANPTDAILSRIASQWGGMGIKLTVALSPATMINNAPTASSFAGITVTSVAAPISGCSFFNLTVGYGANAIQNSRSGRISYVNYGQPAGQPTRPPDPGPAGTGYIYNTGTNTSIIVNAISHELAHILGLTDRYYEGVYWLNNRSINRTCQQIRQGLYPTVSGQPDLREGNFDKFTILPRMAVRCTLPMSDIMFEIPDKNNPNNKICLDPQYSPYDNLMSTSSPVLTKYQIDLIKNCTAEEHYRKNNWVADLGVWEQVSTAVVLPKGALSGNGGHRPEKYNDLTYWPFPAWEARPEDKGRGLLCRPPEHPMSRYPCRSPAGRARDENNDIVDATRLATSWGSKNIFVFVVNKLNKTVNHITSYSMCHLRQTTLDLMGF